MIAAQLRFLFETEDSVNNKLFMKTCLKSHFELHKQCVQHLFSEDRNLEQQLKQ